jgi:type III secretion protein J
MVKLVIVLFLGLLTIGCNDESLYSDLGEVEANEIVALLSNAGIIAYKVKNNDDTFTVSTQRKDFAEAIDLLKTNGYPKNQFDSIGEVFKKEGFVSSPLEEQARLNYAQSQELSRTIESIDGVILARVHLAIPKENKLESKAKPASASVFIKHRRGIDLTDRESQIKALLVNSIAGLPYENVTVAMFSSNPIPVKRKHVNKEDESIFSSMTASEIEYIIIGLTVLIFILIIVSVLLLIKSRKQSSQLQISNSST